MLKLSEILMDALPGEKSAGAIIFRKSNKGLQYLLLFGDKIGWGFPKGHIDGGEVPMDTAKREIEEETGIIIDKFIPNFEVYTQYDMKFDYSKTPPEPLENPYQKTCVYYLSEVGSTQSVKISHEHEKYVWATYSAAQDLLKFNNDILKKANRMISNGTRNRSIHKGKKNN
jgi:8-oxo-dGTP pyrophosphatase MutT (NUDIX family)